MRFSVDEREHESVNGFCVIPFEKHTVMVTWTDKDGECWHDTGYQVEVKEQ